MVKVKPPPFAEDKSRVKPGSSAIRESDEPEVSFEEVWKPSPHRFGALHGAIWSLEE
jgi:hypothetical protein